MSIRLPLKVVGSFTDSGDTGTGSVGGAIMHTFMIPQDTDNVVVKLTASCVGAGLSAVLQTTDDSGSTWYDVGRTSVVSNAVNATAQWLSVPVTGGGVKTAGTFATGSIVSMGIGSAQSLQAGSQTVTGLPILSQYARVAVVITGDVTTAASNACVTKVMVNSQSK